MKETRNSKFKLVAFSCYLDLKGGVGADGGGGGAWLTDGLCTSFH